MEKLLYGDGNAQRFLFDVNEIDLKEWRPTYSWKTAHMGSLDE